MTKARRSSLIVLAFSSAILLLLGIALQRSSRLGMLDFKALYYGSGCLRQHCDPYNQRELDKFFVAEGGARPSDPPQVGQVVTQYVNLPTTFLITIWFSMLSWTTAHVLWTMLTTMCFLTAALMVWSMCEDMAPLLAACLIGFLVANSEVMVAGGNAAGLVVSLCIIGVWCFVQERFVPIGIGAMALSLLVKPHDSGLVWLYLLLAGGMYRRRAWQTLIVAAGLAVPAIFLVWRVAPHWAEELGANLAALSARGGFNDPGPSSYVARTAGDVIDLQSVISVIRDDPRLYNPIAYGVCAVLFLPLAVAAWRLRVSPKAHWLGLAAVSAITMLVTYHKPVDARLLLLSVPGCTTLFAERGIVRILGAIFTAFPVVLTSDIPSALLTQCTREFHVVSSGIFGRTLAAVAIRPVPLALLAMAVFYLCVLARLKEDSSGR